MKFGILFDNLVQEVFFKKIDKETVIFSNSFCANNFFL